MAGNTNWFHMKKSFKEFGIIEYLVLLITILQSKSGCCSESFHLHRKHRSRLNHIWRNQILKFCFSVLDNFSRRVTNLISLLAYSWAEINLSWAPDSFLWFGKWNISEESQKNIFWCFQPGSNQWPSVCKATLWKLACGMQHKLIPNEEVILKSLVLLKP